MAAYLHVLEGRIRIKIPEVKGAPDKAGEVERQVRALDPSIDAKANPITGNILLVFDPGSIHKDRILELFRGMGYLTCDPANVPAVAVASSPSITTDASSALVRRLLEIGLQVAIERLIFALI